MRWTARLADVFHRDAPGEVQASQDYNQARERSGVPPRGKVWELFHPGQAEGEFYAVEEAEASRMLAGEEAARQADADYYRWAENEYHQGNPPESELRDTKIAYLAEIFPEVSGAEHEQAAFYREARELDLREGPGFTEPPLNWTGGHDPEWTFGEWAEERGYSAEWIEEVNEMYPRDPREVEYAQGREEREAAAVREYDRQTRGWLGREWDDPPLTREEAFGTGPHPPFDGPGAARRGDLTFVPDPRLGEQSQREVREGPDPYNPLNFASYSYWPDPEAGS